jgi:hypothetical protein
MLLQFYVCILRFILKKYKYFVSQSLLQFLQFHTLCNKVCYKLAVSFSLHKISLQLFQLAMSVLGNVGTREDVRGLTPSSSLPR